MKKIRLLKIASVLILAFITVGGCKKDYKRATLKTTKVTEITSTTAKSGGTITDNGGISIISRGVCWGTSTKPTIADSFTSDGSGSGTFSSSMEGLIPGTTYYVRAYATNSEGTGYGNEFTFTTTALALATLTTAEVTAITSSNATSGGNITSDGGSEVTARGVAWGTTENPTIEGSITSDGEGSGVFTSNLADLTPGTTYYVRAYATNAAGTGYGNQVTFSTLSQSLPTLTSIEITDITSTTAASGGNITNNGGTPVIMRGVVWSTSENPTIEGNKTTNGEGNGIFTSNLGGLSPGTTYYVRAYATNSAGTAYGNQLSFTTTGSLATLTTSDATEITATSAKSGGEITSTGASPVTARGVVWNTSENPTIDGNKTADGDGTGTFVSNITGLSPATTYYVRAYATNSAGTAYGNQVQLTTATVEAWMLSPWFALPQTGLTLMAGQEVTIYGDALINVPIQNNLQVSYSSDIGTQSGNNFILNPSSADLGDHELTITFMNDEVLITSQTITYTVYEKASSGSKKILLIGDSTTPPELQQQQITSVLDNSTLTFLGTVGTTYKGEGYGGASWNGFITGTHGKFTKSGVLNIPAYFADNAIETPDYVFIRLGINDTFRYSRADEGPITDSDIAGIVARAKTLIDAFLAFNPSLKVILGLPTTTENSGAGWALSYDELVYNQDMFLESIHHYRKNFVETFANGAYDERVDVSYEAIFLDRNEGYPKTGGIHNNGVHPDDSGYEQLGTGMALIFNKLIISD